MAEPRVLVVDDEVDLARLLVFNLRQAAFEVEVAGTAREALDLASRLLPDVIVLDIGLPDQSGLEVCRLLRRNPALAHTSILMLTAHGEEEDRVSGFEVGADDYVVKPYMVREVVARIRVLARRASERQIARAAAVAAEPAKALCWRELSVDTASHRVFWAGLAVDLRPLEYKLLVYMLERPGRVVTRDQLLDSVWGDATDISPRTVDTHMRRLRSALGEGAEVIETVHGFGYRCREA